MNKARARKTTLADERLTDGHYPRLRREFLQGVFAGFLDCEIIELLLSWATPR